VIRPHVDTSPFEQDARGLLDKTIANLGELKDKLPDLRPLPVEGDAATALMGAAADAALLVVGSRGHGGFLGLRLGSVSQRCVDHAPCSVAVIPPTWVTDGKRRIVVGVDGSASSSRALDWAVEEAARENARLDVVNAYQYYPVISPFGPVAVSDRDELEKASKDLLDRMVEAALDRAGARRPAIELMPVSGGAAHNVLAIAEDADLLVVGSLGGGRFHGHLIGSVSRQCVHHATCPVVIVRPPLA
jgi:nucleotide-binding universal stress UspA family protein